VFNVPSGASGSSSSGYVNVFEVLLEAILPFSSIFCANSSRSDRIRLEERVTPVVVISLHILANGQRCIGRLPEEKFVQEGNGEARKIGK